MWKLKRLYVKLRSLFVKVKPSPEPVTEQLPPTEPFEKTPDSKL